MSARGEGDRTGPVGACHPSHIPELDAVEVRVEVRRAGQVRRDGVRSRCWRAGLNLRAGGCADQLAVGAVVRGACADASGNGGHGRCLRGSCGARGQQRQDNGGTAPMSGHTQLSSRELCGRRSTGDDEPAATAVRNTRVTGEDNPVTVRYPRRGAQVPWSLTTTWGALGRASVLPPATDLAANPTPPPAWPYRCRCHAVFTNPPITMLPAEAQHRGHAAQAETGARSMISFICATAYRTMRATAEPAGRHSEERGAATVLRPGRDAAGALPGDPPHPVGSSTSSRWSRRQSCRSWRNATGPGPKLSATGGGCPSALK